MTDSSVTITEMQAPATPDALRFALPTGRLVLAAIAIAAGWAGAWSAVAMMAGWDMPVARCGWAGALAVVVPMGASLAMISPWMARESRDWMNAWIVLMGLRLTLTPLGTILLYFAAALSPEALAISVAIAFLLSLLAEAAVLARHVRRQTGLWRTAPEARRTGRG